MANRCAFWSAICLARGAAGHLVTASSWACGRLPCPRRLVVSASAVPERRLGETRAVIDPRRLLGVGVPLGPVRPAWSGTDGSRRPGFGGAPRLLRPRRRPGRLRSPRRRSRGCAGGRRSRRAPLRRGRAAVRSRAPRREPRRPPSAARRPVDHPVGAFVLHSRGWVVINSMGGRCVRRWPFRGRPGKRRRVRSRASGLLRR